jgi:hypothetical protein
MDREAGLHLARAFFELQLPTLREAGSLSE